MSKIIFIVLLTLGLLTLNPSKVLAVSCSSSSESYCTSKSVGQGCVTGATAFKCVPTTWSSNASNGSVSCNCIQIQSGSSDETLLNQWVVSNSSSSTGSSDSTSPNYVPPDCPTTFITDLGCVNAKIFDPSNKCQINKCPGDSQEPDPILTQYSDQLILGLRIRIGLDAIPSLINIAITTFLGIIALYALFRGIYVAGIKRTQATNEDELVKINKELTNIVLGFVIAFAFIFIVQLVFNLLGLGGVTDVKVSFTGTEDTSAPQIVITGNAS